MWYLICGDSTDVSCSSSFLGAFTLGMAYFNYQMFNSYSEVPLELINASSMTWVFFNWMSFNAYTRLNSLFEMILKSERLIEEISKIIQFFPHGVLIQSAEKLFINQEFKRLHANITELSDLQNTDVQINEEDINHPEDIGYESLLNKDVKNLNQLFTRQIARLKNDDVVEQHSVWLKIGLQIEEQRGNLWLII